MMVDLVGTCPKDFWLKWIAEGDAAGDPETGEEWGWFTEHSYRSLIKPGDRFYVVAWGRLRGYSIVTGMWRGAIVRKGNAVACTIPDNIPGFRGLRKRWWHRDSEKPFPEWKTEGFIAKSRARRHRWREVYRDERKTERICDFCPIVKVTRHEPGANPPHWIEFWQGLDRIETTRTPACEPAA